MGLLMSNSKNTVKEKGKEIPLIILVRKSKSLLLKLIKREKKVKQIDRKEIEPYTPDSSIKFLWDNELMIFDDFNHAMDIYESGSYTLFYINSSSEGGPFWEVIPREAITKLNQRHTIEALVAGGIDKDQAAKEVIGWVN